MPQSLEHPLPTLELDTMALAIIKADRFDRGKALQRPSETGRRILAAGKQDKPLFGDHIGCRGRILIHADEIEPRMASINKPAAPRYRPLL